ncbi:tRNA 2-thiouridine(34) synthase MnmA [uncultured Acetobacteroides sp.]|uniref:tRNA 2-thiouridine(34) synthase MnmA n=1 Tax=uncultured Acetobacteroides sp. TaxID=1760811 RepID=UPI0029F51EED|nr:tRNA 2-thiouridine(34) synthase MnmA [uncultured Acetobacteroides sp.]
MEKVAVGMSGGIDSTLTAIKLKESGFQVVGVTLWMVDGPKSAKAIEDAELQAKRIGIEHHVVDCSEAFTETIVRPFAEAYLKGETPSPCAWCNPQVKWRQLADFADSIGARYIASGHYVQTAEHNGHYYVLKGEDSKKDQSYYLWMLPESIIRRMVQPLGTILKEQAKQEIRDRHFDDLVPNHESMSVCFLEGMDYRHFIAQLMPERMAEVRPGEVLDEAGNAIGRHSGIPFYTIGQKRGLELTTEREAYIQSMDSASNTITIGKKADLLRSEFRVREVHLIRKEEITPTTPLEVKVRGLGLNPEGYGYLTIEGDAGTVTLDNPAWAISPGQPVVFYIGDRLVGGAMAVS